MNHPGEPLPASNKPRSIREHNLHVVLQLFRQQDILSIHDISRAVGLSKTTVTKVVNRLLEKGLVVSKGKGASTEEGGKKPELFSLNVEKAYIVSLSPGTFGIHSAVLDVKCRFLRKKTWQCGAPLGYREALVQMAHMTEELLEEQMLSPSVLAAVVVGCEGVVDGEKGILHYPIHHDWGKELPIARDLQAILPYQVPILVDNACRFLGYAELAARGEAALGCVVTLFSAGGTGGCVIQDGRIMMGRNGFVGELGHVVLDSQSDILCNCGNCGCFEALVSPRRVLEQVRQSPKFPASSLYSCKDALAMEAVFAAAQNGDALAREVLDPVIGHFAALIHNTVLLLDPQEVIIQGIYARGGDYFLEQLRERVGAFRFYRIPQKLAIHYSRLESSGEYDADFLRGGGYYAAGRYFDQLELHAHND